MESEKNPKQEPLNQGSLTPMTEEEFLKKLGSQTTFRKAGQTFAMHYKKPTQETKDSSQKKSEE